MKVNHLQIDTILNRQAVLLRKMGPVSSGFTGIYICTDPNLWILIPFEKVRVR